MMFRRRLCLAFLLASVICAQALGFMHGIAHAFHVDTQQTEHVRDTPRVPEPVSSADGENWIEALFAYHDDSEDCRMFDGLGQPTPIPLLAALSPVLMPSMCHHRLLHGAFIARWAALFDARGPPPSH